MKKTLFAATVVLLLTFCTMPVLASDVSDASYVAEIQIVNSGDAANNVVATFDLSTEDMIAGGMLNETADNAVMLSVGSDVPFQPGIDGVSPWATWVPAIGSGASLSQYLYTGDVTGGQIAYFPDVTGMSVPDNAALELSNYGAVTWSGYIDADSEGTIWEKEDAITLTRESGTVKLSLFNPKWNVQSTTYANYLTALVASPNGEYVFAQSSTDYKIWKILTSDLSVVTTTAASAGGWANQAVVDDEYVYIALGGPAYSVKKYKQSDMSLVATSNVYGTSTPKCLSISSGYIYVGYSTADPSGYFHIRRFATSDFTASVNTSTGYSVNSIHADGSHVYAGIYVLTNLRRYNLDLSGSTDSTGYSTGGVGWSSAGLWSDDTYVYASKYNSQQVQAFSKSTFAYAWQTPAYGSVLSANNFILTDDHIVLVGTTTLKISRYSKVNGTLVDQSTSFTGSPQGITNYGSSIFYVQCSTPHTLYRYEYSKWDTLSAPIISGEHEIKGKLDGTNLNIYVDDGLVDSAALASLSVPDNANQWIFYGGCADSSGYINYVGIDVADSPVDQWEWQPAATFTGTISGITATPSFPATSSDEDVTATVGTIDTTVSSSIPASLAASGWSMVTEVPGEPVGLYRDGGTNFPGGTELAQSAEESGNPPEFFLIPAAIGTAILAGFAVYGATHNSRLGIRGSLALQSVTSILVCVIWIFAGDGVVQGWILIPFGLELFALLLWSNPYNPVT